MRSATSCDSARTLNPLLDDAHEMAAFIPYVRLRRCSRDGMGYLPWLTAVIESWVTDNVPPIAPTARLPSVR